MSSATVPTRTDAMAGGHDPAVWSTSDHEHGVIRHADSLAPGESAPARLLPRCASRHWGDAGCQSRFAPHVRTGSAGETVWRDSKGAFWTLHGALALLMEAEFAGNHIVRTTRRARRGELAALAAHVRSHAGALAAAADAIERLA